MHEHIKRYSRISDSVALEGQEHVSYGKPNIIQEACDAVDFDICPDLILAAIAAAGAAAFVALYVALTMQPNGRRKRKRSLKDNAPQRRSNGLEEVFHMFLLGNYQTEINALACIVHTWRDKIGDNQ